MDPFSLAASAFACIQITDRIVSICKHYVLAVEDAPSDLRAIAVEIGSVKCVLEMLHIIIERGGYSDHSDILRRIETSDGPIQSCHKALIDLEKLFPCGKEATADGK